ncbi:MAG: PLP-dependent aminotransferase family protein [Pirellulales bacterium]
MLPTFRPSQRAQLASGQPIGELMSMALANPNLISLAAGFVDQTTLPVDVTREALDSLLADEGLARVALQYGTTAGHFLLREQLVERLQAADRQPDSEKNISVQQMVVTAGSNELLFLLADVLCDPGDIVLCAAPTYFVFLGALANQGIRAVGVAGDCQGIIPEAIEAELERIEAAGELDRVRAIYVTTSFDNPGTSTLAAKRRPQLVEIAQRWSRRQTIHIIEDAAYRDLRYDGDDIPSLRAFDESGETVILTGTFSKCYSPGVRVGWGLLPPALVEPVLDVKTNINFGSSNFAQHLVSKVLELDLLEDHISRLREQYRIKRDAMLIALHEHLAQMPGATWTRPDGGLYVWLTLPDMIDAGPLGQLLKRCVAEGVLYVPGEYSYPREGAAVRHNTIRLSFGDQSPERIGQGIAGLARAVQQVLQR